MSRFYRDGFPHSDIPGSKVARHLPGAYRSHATSFIAFRSQGIHHLPLIKCASISFFKLPYLIFKGLSQSFSLHPSIIKPPLLEAVLAELKNSDFLATASLDVAQTQATRCILVDNDNKRIQHI